MHAQSCLSLCDPTDRSPPGSSVHGIFQARILESVAVSFSRGSSRPRDRIRVSCISCIGRQSLHHYVTWEARFLPYSHCWFCKPSLLPSKYTLLIKNTAVEKAWTHQAKNFAVPHDSKSKSFRKTSISALLTMPKPLTVWITINCGKFWKRWEYQTTLPASWETCTQVRKQQLELDMEQQTGSK